MMRQILKCAMILSSVQVSAASDISVIDVFRQGEELVESNSSDSYLANQEDLLRGIRLVESALDRGYEDKESAYKLLIKGYTSLAASFIESQSERYKDVVDRIDALNERLAQVDPGDVGSKMALIAKIKKRERRLEKYIKLSHEHPENAHLQYIIGEHFLKQGRTDEAFKYLKNAIRLADLNSAIIYGNKLVRELKLRGRSKEAEEISDELDKRSAESREYYRDLKEKKQGAAERSDENDKESHSSSEENGVNSMQGEE